MPPASLSAAAPLVRALPVTSSLFTLTSYFYLAPPAVSLLQSACGWQLPRQREPRKGGRRPAGRRIPLSVPFGDSSPSRGALEEGAGLPPGGRIELKSCGAGHAPAQHTTACGRGGRNRLRRAKARGDLKRGQRPLFNKLYVSLQSHRQHHIKEVLLLPFLGDDDAGRDAGVEIGRASCRERV